MQPPALQQAFRARFGAEPRLFRAPGRVNLIGEHTDYNDGFVLPFALDRGVWVAVAPRADARVRAHSLALGATVEFALDAPFERSRSFRDYVWGVALSLAARGVALRGADLLVASDLPIGAGLSSSAALEIGVGLALLAAAGAELDRVELARAAQAAEHTYAGTRCGIMDQLASALGERDRALLVDCRSLRIHAIPFPATDPQLLVCDTGVAHQLGDSAYDDRRAACERAVARLQRRFPELRALRDASEDELAQAEAELPPPLLQRCRHVVTENARTVQAAGALELHQFAELGRLMYASHASLRDDYEVSCPELDCIVDTARELPGVFGARMTGGGFGGSAIVLVRRDDAAAAQDAIERAYRARFGAAPRVFACAAGPGAHEIALG